MEKKEIRLLSIGFTAGFLVAACSIAGFNGFNWSIKPAIANPKPATTAPVQVLGDKPSVNLNSSSTETSAVALSNNEKLFSDMTSLDMRMAKLQMETKLVQMEVEKLRFLMDKDGLLKELKASDPVAAAGFSLADTSVTQGSTGSLGASSIQLLGLSEFGGDKSAKIFAAGRIQELTEGEFIEGLGLDCRLNKIEPNLSSVTILENGLERKYYLNAQ